ncbi:MAG: response regulator [bacterium]|nr:response regulator [bacterium]
MSEQPTIRVLIAEESTEARINLKKLFFTLPREIEIIAEIDTPEDIIPSAVKTRPDIIFLNIALEQEEGMKITEGLVEENPEIGIVILSDQELFPETIQEAMLAGARGLLIQPINREKLAETVLRIVKIQEKEKEHINASPSALPPESRRKVITLFSTKGGSGGSLLSVNLAVMLAKILQPGGEKVALMDLDLQFGDCAVMLNLTPTKTIAGLVKEISEQGKLEESLLESYLIKHDTGLKLLAAPLKPEQAELVNGAHIEEIINVLKSSYNFIIIDSPKHLNDSLLAALNLSDLILFVFTLDLPAIKNARLGLDIIDSLGFKDKVSLVINRTETRMGITPSEVEEALNYPILGQIPSDGRKIIPSINEGTPFVLGYEKELVTKRVEELAMKIIGEDEDKAKQKEGWLKGLFSGKTKGG